jgi:hypothetical protein
MKDALHAEALDRAEALRPVFAELAGLSHRALARHSMVEASRPPRAAPGARCKSSACANGLVSRVEAGDKSKLDRVGPYPENDRNRRGRGLCRQCPGGAIEANSTDPDGRLAAGCFDGPIVNRSADVGDQ